MLSSFWTGVARAMTPPQPSSSRHIWPRSLRELFAFDDALAAHLRVFDRCDMAERAFSPFRDRFFSDEFLGWRCACVAGGRGCYADALAGRSAPPPGERFEELVFALMRAWARRSGANPAGRPHGPRPGFRTYANGDGWEWAASTHPHRCVQNEHIERGMVFPAP